MLKQEARRGMSILATIHQPSAEVLNQFNRIIILSEGQTIYNGRTSDIPSFFL
jgi:ABC-type multidrug transport system ATPase subunit